ncbi:MAG TPA: hypothetical protein PKM71_04330 [Candidatus Cloacimonas sp.]|nr:hypothetical protein [Candidatus Cloacimonas sp.]
MSNYSGVNDWTTNGSYLSNQKLSADMRAQALGMYVWRQFVDKKDGLGANAGDVVTFSKRMRIATQGTTLVETSQITQQLIKVTKGTCSVSEFGNKVLTSLKAATLSKFNLKSEYGKGLMEDQVAAIDLNIYTQFTGAKFKAVCTNSGKTHVEIKTTGTATSTATRGISKDNFRGIVDYAKKAHIPKIGSYYICVGATDFISSLYDDLQSVAMYAEPEFRYKDEVGRYYGSRFIEDNVTCDNTAGNSQFGEGFLFGEEAVCEAVALPEELRYYDEEAGRFNFIVWLAILGHAKMWDRVTDGASSPDLNGLERIIHITSA